MAEELLANTHAERPTHMKLAFSAVKTRLERKPFRMFHSPCPIKLSPLHRQLPMSGDEIMVNKAFAEAHPKHASKMAIARAGLGHRTIRSARMKALRRWQWRWRKRPQRLDEFRSATIS